MKHYILVLLSCGLWLQAQAQGTAFTYQGRLNASGGPVNGIYDLRFAIYDSVNDGFAVGVSVTNSTVAVSNGLFAVRLDFGTGVFDGNSRWLEIAVRPTGGGAFTSLAPRQPITAAPYAIFAANSGTGSGTGLWQVNNGTNSVHSVGNVGIGSTSPPEVPLHIVTAGESIRVQGPEVGAANSAWVSFVDAFGFRIGYVGDGSTSDGSIFLTSDGGDAVLETSAGRAVNAKPDGRVGIGTTTPQAKLEVRGDIRLGSGGELQATSGEENLRIIRGVVNQDGNIITGSGFSVSQPTAGRYTITFNAPFVGTPTVTATAFFPGGNNESRYAAVQGVTSSTADVLVFKDNTDSNVFYQRVSGTFHFIAIGPR